MKSEDTVPSAAGADITIAIDRCLAVITLQRVRALNALTASMRTEIAAAVPGFAREPQVYAVLLQSTSPRAFSAGSDVREIVQLAQRSRAEARAAFADEYRMNWLLECFSKPTISLIDGMVMGGGVGISGFNTHRVAGEAYSWAMPETMIGLFPDVGAAHALSRLGPEGQYLALTGRSIGRADAFRLGLASHCIAAQHFPRIAEDLALANTVDPLLDGLHEDPGTGELEAYADVIALAFSACCVEDIVSRLDAVQGAKRAWAQQVVADLRKRSPLSLKVTHRHLKEAAALDIQRTLIADYRLACRFLEGHDFYEGVRASIIDKDGAPAWSPASLAAVTADQVDRYFVPLPASEELVLPSREDMQKARV
ncbi:MAG: enoyl-CoA hydratase/isomerase family protein [Hyphomicrobiaceae bacterium]|nr:enoyl-CoA hydratase/isomerase family protein [Hyphomicrobiaceae bacterium]